MAAVTGSYLSTSVKDRACLWNDALTSTLSLQKSMFNVGGVRGGVHASYFSSSERPSYDSAGDDGDGDGGDGEGKTAGMNKPPYLMKAPLQSSYQVIDC